MSKTMAGRVRKRSRGTAGLAVLLSAALLTACGSQSSGDNDGEAGVSQEESSIRTIDPYGGNPEDEPKPEPGGTLTIAADRAEISFDPKVGGTNVGATAIYDSLMKLDAESNPQPYVAESMKSSDNVTWTLGLRDNVNFSDGTPLDAEAVRINVQRHIDDPKSVVYPYAQQIASMRVVDDKTVEFTLKAPNGLFPVLFAGSFGTANLGAIVSPAALQQWGPDIGAHPVGVGPFTLQEWVRDSKVTLVKNPNYWQKGLPYLDSVEIRPVPDTDSRYASIENGDFDVDMGAYQPELYKAVRNDDLRVYYGYGNGSEYIYFNHTRAPFDDRRMREAVVRGIDLNAMAATQFQGDMAATKEWFGPDSPFASKEAQDAWPKFDLEAAKKLVADYVADGGSANVVYKTTNASNRVAFAQFLQAQMTAIGITMEVQPYDLAQYASSVIRSRDFQFAGWVGGPVDNPYPNLFNLAGSTGNANYGSYANPEVDQLLTQALATTDEDERADLYKQVSLKMNEDIAVGWTNRGYLSHITQKNVYGIDRTLVRDLFLAKTWKDQ